MKLLCGNHQRNITKTCIALFTCTILAFAIYIPSNVLARSSLSPNQSPLRDETSVGLVFADPFGYFAQSPFETRHTWDTNGNLIENTDYGIKNPDLGSTMTCFSQRWDNLLHAGIDLYFIDWSVSTSGFALLADADGYVRYAPTNINYPGSVIIIEHQVPPISGRIYSVYAHIEPSTVNVTEGQWVDRGHYLGNVMYQDYTGAYPAYHNDDDSHLHFEIRNFYDASQIYSSYPSCNIYGNTAGKGYNYPQSPDLFPSTSSHYLDPLKFIYSHQYHTNLPLAIKN